MRIAKDELFTGVFKGTLFNNDTPAAQWTSHVGLLTFIGKVIGDVVKDDLVAPNKIQASKILGMVATKMYFYQRELYQVVDAVLTEEQKTEYGINQADIDKN